MQPRGAPLQDAGEGQAAGVTAADVTSANSSSAARPPARKRKRRGSGETSEGGSVHSSRQPSPLSSGSSTATAEAPKKARVVLSPVAESSPEHVTAAAPPHSSPSQSDRDPEAEISSAPHAARRRLRSTRFSPAAQPKRRHPKASRAHVERQRRQRLAELFESLRDAVVAFDDPSDRREHSRERESILHDATVVLQRVLQERSRGRSEPLSPAAVTTAAAAAAAASSQHQGGSSSSAAAAETATAHPPQPPRHGLISTAAPAPAPVMPVMVINPVAVSWLLHHTRTGTSFPTRLTIDAFHHARLQIATPVTQLGASAPNLIVSMDNVLRVLRANLPFHQLLGLQPPAGMDAALASATDLQHLQATVNALWNPSVGDTKVPIIATVTTLKSQNTSGFFQCLGFHFVSALPPDASSSQPAQPVPIIESHYFPFALEQRMA